MQAFFNLITILDICCKQYQNMNSDEQKIVDCYVNGICNSIFNNTLIRAYGVNSMDKIYDFLDSLNENEKLSPDINSAIEKISKILDDLNDKKRRSKENSAHSFFPVSNDKQTSLVSDPSLINMLVARMFEVKMFKLKDESDKSKIVEIDIPDGKYLKNCVISPELILQNINNAITHVDEMRDYIASECCFKFEGNCWIFKILLFNNKGKTENAFEIRKD